MSIEPDSDAPEGEAVLERTIECASGDRVDTDSISGTATHGTGPESSVLRRQRYIGKEFGDLVLLEEIGRGGMGVVYKARQKSLDRIVAVKLLLHEEFQDETRLARFRAEARAAASLTHANIVQVYQVGECDIAHYFVMEYVDGPSLESLIKAGKLLLGTAINILISIADAVHFAHTKGIVHRDLKPANIMIDRGQRPVVMDFGIAKVLGKSSNMTQHGVVMGTPAFMSPEQAGDEPDRVGPHSDVYSLGAILYMMLAGRAPFDEGTTLRTILKVISAEMPTSIRAIRPQIPEELERICLKCLQKKPEDRHKSAETLAGRLREFLADPRKKSAEASPLPVVVLRSRSAEKQIRLTRPVSIVGRTSDCDVVLRASDISKQHCRITIEPDRVTIEDLGSANGTFVNGTRIQKAQLEDRDRVRFADHEFKVRLARPRTSEWA
jgi:serine/threonine protein kinase